MGELGLEIIILRNGDPSGDVHVCDECILDMFSIRTTGGIRKQLQVNFLEKELVLRERLEREKIERDFENQLLEQNNNKESEPETSIEQTKLEEIEAVGQKLNEIEEMCRAFVKSKHKRTA